MLTRRELMRFGLLGGAAALLPLEQLVSLASALSAAPHPANNAFGGISPGSPPVVPFSLPLRIPPVLRPVATDADTDYYELTMRPAPAQILPGLLTTIWGYDGLYPGPTIRAQQGRRVVVRQVNNVAEPTAVHLHGGKIAPEHDGHPIDLIPPGGYRDYVYPNRQPGLTMWYHDHANHQAGPHIYRGLAGFYLLEGDDEAGFGLPSGSFDVPLMLQDRILNPDGSLSYPGYVHGFYGDTTIVNGVAQPRFDVAARKYRLRLLNAANHREFNLAFTPAVPTFQIATDGGLLPAPVPRPSTMFLAPAERIELVVDFSGVPQGSRIVLRDTLGTARTAPVMAFDVTRAAADDSRLPGSLRPLPSFPPPSRVRNFDLHFDEGRQMWVINGKGFDPARVDARPRLNSTEVWQFTNLSDLMHPMHLHLAHFQILTRRGGAPPPAYEAGVKDTVAVGPFETVRVLASFTGFTGRYVFHCHRLEHEDWDMMGQMEVLSDERPDGVGGGVP
ncbi:MAG: multicopper oxidase family protein [Actinomycetota bacterium]|nr:multicopper oxidase family protein [Actinomycetota bacterium]